VPLSPSKGFWESEMRVAYYVGPWLRIRGRCAIGCPMNPPSTKNVSKGLRYSAVFFVMIFSLDSLLRAFLFLGDDTTRRRFVSSPPPSPPPPSPGRAHDRVYSVPSRQVICVWLIPLVSNPAKPCTDPKSSSWVGGLLPKRRSYDPLDSFPLPVGGAP